MYFAIGGALKGFWSGTQFNVTGNGIFSGNGTFGGTLGVTGAITGASVTTGNSNLGSNSSHLANLTVNNNGYIGSANDSTALNFTTAGDLVATGKVGIGTAVNTAPSATLHVSGAFKVNTTTVDGNEARLYMNPGGAADDPQLILYRHDGSSPSVYLRPGNYNYFENKILMGTQTAVNDSNSIGNPPVQLTDAEPGVSLYGSGTGTYSHSGGISFGSAGGSGADRSFFYIYAHPENWHVYNNSSRGFYFPQGSTAVIAYASDERLKENIVDLNLGLTAINSLKPRRFDWKSDGADDIGFVAQELKLHIPEAIQGSGADWVEGEEKGERDSKTLKIGNDKLIPVLVKAVQELSAELTAAKARITALEG